MATRGTETIVTVQPRCDLCVHIYGLGDLANPASYDGKTKQGPWANMCSVCFNRFGVGLGIGLGQRLVLAPTHQEK